MRLLYSFGVGVCSSYLPLGWFFKYQKEVTDKTELLVMITPYVIETEDVLAQYAENFNKKMSSLRDKLHQRDE